jgi:hypothetical protein
VTLLQPHLPTLVSGLASNCADRDRGVFDLIRKLVPGDLQNPPGSFVELMMFMDSLTFDDISNQCLDSLMKRARKASQTRDFAALVVLAHLSRMGVLDEFQSHFVIDCIKGIMEDEGEDAQSTVDVCITAVGLGAFAS